MQTYRDIDYAKFVLMKSFAYILPTKQLPQAVLINGDLIVEYLNCYELQK